MIFREITLKDAFVVEMEPVRDDRGFFARAWCQREFEARGQRVQMVQANIGFSHHQYTLRGLHYQLPPFEEAKLTRCIRGRICEVVVDLRPGSPTFRQWESVELRAGDGRMLFVPTGCARGYLTLEDNSEVFYQVSQFYAPEYERGVRWDDPAFGIEWPETDGLIVSAKDRSWPAFHLE